MQVRTKHLGDVLGYFEKHNHLSNNCCVWPSSDNFGLLLIPSSGHTCVNLRTGVGRGKRVLSVWDRGRLLCEKELIKKVLSLYLRKKKKRMILVDVDEGSK